MDPCTINKKNAKGLIFLSQTREGHMLWPYALFSLTLGFGWFILAPLVPYLIGRFHTSLTLVLLLISLYGYAMIAGALPAGYWVAKSGPRPALQTAIVLTVIGLGVRAFSTNFSLALAGQIIAAVAYPFLIAPIGSVLRLGQVRQLKLGTGMVIGMLFLGMAIGSFAGPSMAPSTDLWLAVGVNAVSGIWLWTQLPATSALNPRALGTTRLVMSWWWVIGFVVASMSVMLGSVSTSALIHLRVENAAALGGLLSGLTFLGSALGAIVFGWVGENPSSFRQLPRLLGVLTLIFLVLSGLLLTGTLSASTAGLDSSFLLFGLFSNGWYALALESSAERARSRTNAGIATAGFSMASNIGVAVIPVLVGPLVIAAPGLWIGVVAVLALAAALVPFLVKSSAQSGGTMMSA